MRWILAILTAAFAAASYADDIGQIKTVRGSVHIEREGQRLDATPGMAVRQADRLVTGADGAVGVTFLDNSLLSAGPGSVLAIDRFNFNTTTHAGQFDASLQKGTLAVVSGKIVKQSPGAMRVRTPASVMGVRGTEFLVSVGEAAN
ncbi:MAG TPA: FecR domain-containing protein [Burkholderiales bacterium]